MNILKMCLSLIVAVAAGTLIVQPAAAEDCEFHSFQTTGEWEQVDSEEFTWCFIFPVVGTINGDQLSCSNEADFRTTNDIWGDGDTGFGAHKWFAVFETENGEIHANQWGVFEIATFLQSTILVVTGGTGDYEGATGALTMTSKWPELKPDVAKYQGEICSPHMNIGDDNDHKHYHNDHEYYHNDDEYY